MSTCPTCGQSLSFSCVGVGRLAIALSLAVKCVGVVLFQVPNQPIIFTDDALRKKRSEDATIAFTWDHYREWMMLNGINVLHLREGMD